MPHLASANTLMKPDPQMTPPPSKPASGLLMLTILLQLEKSARHAETPVELGFIMVNETLRLMEYRQAVLWEADSAGKIRITAVSGAEKPDENAPFICYLKAMFQQVLRGSEKERFHVLEKKKLRQEDQEEWSLGNALWCPLTTPRGDMPGGLLFTRQSAWNESEIALLERLSDAYAHAWQALREHRPSWSYHMGKAWGTRKLRALLFFILVLSMGLPVRLSVLAPAEIVPSDFLIVSAPTHGVIRDFHVLPNQKVEKGHLLFRLDDTRVRNEYEVLKKTLAVARAEHKRTAQKAFMDEKSRADLLLLKARMDQKLAEADYMAALLKEMDVRADQDGVAVFRDASDWIGKPVVVGEKILTLANPAHTEAEIHLAIEDAINLEKGADVLIFLNTGPGDPLAAKLREASYEARVTPNSILAFRVKASFTQKTSPPRIGLRGTAKLYGEKVSLFYFLMRRPLAALRQYLGF